MTRIALRPTRYHAPETADTRDMESEHLYDALEAWVSTREREYGRRRSEEATQFRSVANPIIKAIRAELRRRKLPKERPEENSG